MERWKTRARSWEFRASKRRLGRRQKASTTRDERHEEAVLPETGHEPGSENSNDHKEIAA